MANGKRICRFCFEKCDRIFKVIERSTHDILKLLQVTANLAISDKLIMCENCSEILQKSFVFKKMCLSIQDNTDAFEYSEKKGHTVCRFCMKLLEDHSFTILDIEDISEKTMFEKYFPELMDLSISKKPVICDVCHESLVIFLSFITISSIVEEKIKEYCKAKSIHYTDSIKLKNVIQFISENIWKENENKFKVLEMEDTVSVKSTNEKMKIEEGTCVLCLRAHEKLKSIDENTKNILDIILPKIDFTGEQDLVMCESCEEMLIKCHDFKARCLHNLNYMVPFFNNEDDVKLNLKDVYLSKNVTCTGVPEDQHICAFCMSLVNNSSAISLDGEEADIMLGRMIEECLPELDLSIIEKPVMCASCRGSLEDCFHFVVNRSLWFTTRDIKREVTGNSTNIIKLEDQFCEDSENLAEGEIGNGGDTVKLEQMFLDDSQDASKNIEEKYESFIEISNREVNNEQKYTLVHAGESNNLSSIKIEDIVCGENETALKEENSVEMEDQKFLLNREIEIKNYDHDFIRFEDGIVLPQTEVTRRLHRREDCSVLNLNKDQSKPDIKHTSTEKQISKIKMRHHEPCSFQTKHKKSLVNYNLILEGFKKRLLTHKDPSEVTIYNCDSCSYQTRNKYYLKKHLLAHKNPSEVTKYKCDSCSYQTRHKYYLKTHLLTHKDPSEMTVYKCDFCSFQTRIKRSLKGHLLKHKDPSEVTMYKCDYCLYQNKLKSCLEIHLLKHKDPSEVKMYKCHFCSFQTITLKYLKAHLRKHKDPSEVTIYKCDICSCQSKTKSYFEAHLLKHKVFSEETMYKCYFCSFQAKTKEYLKRHLPTHKDNVGQTAWESAYAAFLSKSPL